MTTGGYSWEQRRRRGQLRTPTWSSTSGSTQHGPDLSATVAPHGPSRWRGPEGTGLFPKRNDHPLHQPGQQGALRRATSRLAPPMVAARGLAAPSRVSGHTSVVSTEQRQSINHERDDGAKGPCLEGRRWCAPFSQPPGTPWRLHFPSEVSYDPTSPQQHTLTDGEQGRREDGHIGRYAS